MLYAMLALAGMMMPQDAQRMPDDARAWMEDGERTLARALQVRPRTGRARNVVLFIGDGMGVSTVTAARIFAGQRRGLTGERYSLSFEGLPQMALSKTYNSNQQVPDSAGTMSAMMTGVKTRAGVISLAPDVPRGDCRASLRDGAAMPTLLEQAERAGMATGIVTTTRITHATPAATYAHSPERGWYNDADMPPEARAAGCRDIAMQLAGFDVGDGVDVILGGGLRDFLPAGTGPGRRRDGRNLMQEWRGAGDGRALVRNLGELAGVRPQQQVMGLFASSHLPYHADRRAGDPSLAELTGEALRLLAGRGAGDGRGFFLMVEAGRIDHAHHGNNAHRALMDTMALADAVAVALDAVSLDDTLVIVTADHSHVFTHGGYSTLGNPILGLASGNDGRGEPSGKPELADDGKPYTSLAYANGPGAEQSRRRAGRVDTRSLDYLQDSIVPLGSETHGGEDVAIYSGGPWAHLLHGTREQNYIYHVMRHALGLERAGRADGPGGGK